MRRSTIAIVAALSCSLASAADNDGKHYKVVNEDGTIFYGDSVPPELTDYEKEVVNDHAVTIGRIVRKRAGQS